jgi:predicted O-methyltransferase YrrM
MEHFYDQLPGWCDFADLYADRVALASDGAHFVEIGTYAGKSAACMAVEIANSGKRIRFDACDTFQGVERCNFHSDRDYLEQEGRRGEDGTLADFARQNLAPVADFVNVRVGDSLGLAETYSDGSLDFVFIDDDHSTWHVLKELVAWWPKVKPGGMLAGHDVQWPSVAKALKPWGEMAGVTVKSTSATSWCVEKPHPLPSLRTPYGERKCLVAVCSNERSVYRQTASSLMQLGWGKRVTDAAKKHGFADIQFAWVSRYLLVSDIRNEAVRVAKAQGCSHILFLDADMQWPADVLDAMLQHHDMGIVSGLYFLKTWPHWPVALVRPRVNPETLAVDYDYDKAAPFEPGLVPQSLVGMGCALVPMVAIDAIPAPWFEYQQDQNGQWTVTEDVAFCQKAAAVGCPIWLDPQVKCGHVGQQIVSEPWYERSLIEIRRLEEMQEKAPA